MPRAHDSGDESAAPCREPLPYTYQWRHLAHTRAESLHEGVPEEEPMQASLEAGDV